MPSLIERKELIALFPRRETDERGVDIFFGHINNDEATDFREIGDELQKIRVFAFLEEGGKIFAAVPPPFFLAL